MDDNDGDSSTSMSSPSFKFRWDVFLSFRGEDTRGNITERLYSELVRNGIRTFMDDPELERGEEISPGLLTAIEDSATSIAVISKNYANSHWCLDELATILERRRLILPVFFDVDPSDVRRQKGPFEDDFRYLEQRFGEEKVVRWRKAMEKVGGIPGWRSKIRSEKQLIQSLVKEILSKLSNIPLGVAKHPIGINARVEELMRILDVKSNGVRVVGFHGMGGIGKTTLAKAIYNKSFVQFEHHSFITNIKETSRKHNGLIFLQNKLIRDLFPSDVSIDSIVDDVNRGVDLIKEKIHEERVLVVLDDVDNARQLDALAGQRDWFYEGSRIIITTSDIKILTKPFVNEIYELKELSSSESLQLFSYHAFGREKPTKALMHLSEQIISLIRGLPLALEVFGAFLFDKRKIEWKDALEKLKQICPGNLQEVLKISFDGLDEQEKCIFLDIACFFVKMDMKRDYAIDILRGCDFNAEIAFTVLTAKSLIRIIDNDTLWMHDQLRDMGRQIVREESIGDLGKRSRLWVHDEIMKVLKDETWYTLGLKGLGIKVQTPSGASYDQGTRSIQGIIFDFEEKHGKKDISSEQISKVIFRRRPDFTSTISYVKEKFKIFFDCEAENEKEVKLCTKPFEPMKNLRLLQINHVNLVGNFEFVPAALRWLQWKGCPLEALPSDFCPRELAVLDLSESKIKRVWGQIWRGRYKMAERLMVMNLHGCYNLTTTPDLSGYQVLEKLILERCTGLLEIHKSIGDVRSLLHLNLKDCSNLMAFPDDISGLRRLEILILSGCSKLNELPKGLSSMKSLRELLLDETSIVKLPDSISRLKKLERLSLNFCLSLRQLPISIGKLGSLRELSLNDSALEKLPDSFGSLTDLKFLSLMRCRSLNIIPESIGKLESLLELLLDGCPIKELPTTIGSLSHLKYLSVDSCRFLSELPNSIGGLASLLRLRLDSTPITELPDQIGTLNMLEKLEMRNCEMLRCLPDSIGKMFSLTTFILDNSIIKELPESIGLLEKLEIFRGNNCKQLSRLPASIGKLKCLKKLIIMESGVTELPAEFGMLSSLKELKMGRPPHLEWPQNMGGHSGLTVLSAEENPKHSVSPTSFSSLSLLQILDARSCNISGKIPDDFEKLSSLETLELGHNNFCSLPSSLRGLSILKKLSLPNCIELKSLPPLPSSLTHVNVSNCTALEIISDLSNLENLQELCLTNCKQVMDIPGLECLKSLKRTLVVPICALWLQNTLGILYKHNAHACTHMHEVVSNDMVQLQVALKHLRNLSVPGNQIPNWFIQEELSFSSRKNRDIKGVIICVVISLDQQKQDDFRDKLPAVVDIETKILRENKAIFTTTLYLLGAPKTDEDQVYFFRYLNFNLLVSLLKDGEKIQVTMQNPPLELMKYGIHLVFEDDDDDTDHDDDEESPDETQQSVPEKLAKFFSSSDGVWSSDSGYCLGILQSFLGKRNGRRRRLFNVDVISVIQIPLGCLLELAKTRATTSRSVSTASSYGMESVRSVITRDWREERYWNAVEVDPSDVRRQKGPFEEGFRSLEERLGEEKVVRWRKAMEKAGGISGWDSRLWSESELIQSLVKKILIKLSNIPLGVAKHPIGINTCVEELMNILDVKSNGVRIVGFHGMGGIGKTTLQRLFIIKLLFNLNTAASFQISEKLRDNAMVNRGIVLIKEKIHEERVLVVLDDVDDASQLDALAGRRDWFYEGSRIIITTRDIKVLMKPFVNEIYEVKELRSSESLQLFSYHAFGREKPTEAFMHPSEQIISLTGGLPLALEVFGNVQGVLKISFDGLDEQEKRIFLDIACIFVKIDMKRDYAIDKLKGCGFNAEIAFTVLTAKSLIRIIDNNTLWMHDQLRDMGRQIVREASIGDLGKRSRLWNHDKIVKVLKDETGTRSIQGIIFNFEENCKKVTRSEQISKVTLRRMPNLSSTISYFKEKFKMFFDCEAEEEEEEKLCTKPFEPMKNLRLLQINHVKLEGKLELVPAELKWLQWKGCPLEALPSDFCPRELAVLDLSESKIKRVWSQRSGGGYKMPERLMVVNLLGLLEIHKSNGDVRSLLHLNLKDCSNLIKFPDDTSGLRHLEILILSGCSKFEELPQDLSSMKSLRELLVDGTSIVKLPDSISRLKNLERLSLNACRCGSLNVIPDSIGKLKSLLELLLDGCPIKELPSTIGSLSHLKQLSVARSQFLSKLPDSMGGLASLLELCLDRTPITELPDQIGTLNMLEKLEMRNCEMLRCLPDSIGNMLSLTTFILDNAVIKELPESIGLLEKLEIFRVNNCKQLSRLPASIGKLKFLQQFLIVESGVTELPGEFGMLSSLKELKMGKRPHLEWPENMGEQPGLTVLSAQENPKHTVSPTSFSSLCLLQILDACSCKISGIIPDDFEKLSSLETLELGHNNFCSLPSSLRIHPCGCYKLYCIGKYI
ncbi:hypothetical protein HHK36_007133 [Tetracentron sinense]|uniref:TIR domain-containing protein n=1 Tax=Tetracentron sinense TaxID=13715 RepID=A0A834ZMU1_TETSI|nr:hypothetical protein HHK36_007133 [Tetracentron sinense]